MEKSKEIIWIKDKHGDHHVCYIHETRGDGKRYEQLSDAEKKECYNEKLPWS